MARFGFHGRVLHIDLDRHSAVAEEPDDDFWRIYGGGGLLGTAYLLRESRPGFDALEPSAPLIVSTSVIGGQPYAGLAKFTITAKSPLTGGVGESHCEGPFAHAFKLSGADALVVKGRSASPVMVLADGGEVTFHDASELWGLTVSRTVDRLEELFGQDIQVAAIGPAGESLVRFASVVSGRNHQAARTGMGAVLGSKQLKAVVVRGNSLPQVADPATCAALTRSYASRMRENPSTRWQLEPPGFSAWIHSYGVDAGLCVRNCTASVFELSEAYMPDAFMQRYHGEAPCSGCPNDCIKVLAPQASHDSSSWRAGIHQEAVASLGPNLGIADLDVVLKANWLCNEYGLDPASLGFTISMAMECVAHGILSEQEAGLPLRFGNGEALVNVISLIAHREGFGDVLAEGSLRAAAKIGRGTERFALQVKGQEISCFEPRTQGALALGYAVSPVGPRFDCAEHDWDYDVELGPPHALRGARTLGILERSPMATLDLAKVRNFKALSTLWSAADVLDICVFASAPARVLTVEEMATLLGAVTGWETSSWELLRFGERRLQLMRMFNLREGLTAEDDVLPDRFFDEPIPDGRWAGARIDRKDFDAAREAYYAIMGWDSSGRPRFQTLLDHHLEWAALR